MSGGIVEQVRRAYRSDVGAEPAGVWSAPGRVNLIGEHTDYNAGLCLPIALPHRTAVAAGARSDDRLVLTSLAPGLEPVEAGLDEVSSTVPGGWAAYVAGVVWALREEGYAVRGLDLVVDSAVPVGAGLSSSAALTCAVAAATSGVFGLGLLDSEAGRRRLVAAAMRAENDIVGAPTGGLDQTVALFGRAGQALRLDFRSGEMSYVPVDFAAAGMSLVICDTRVSHTLADGQYAARRASCERAAAALGLASLRELRPADLDSAEVVAALSAEELRRVRHVVTEIRRVDACVQALRDGDWDEVGRLFVASHESLRGDYEVSCVELDAVVSEALASGALGARMTGGGFGGSAVVLAPAERVDQVVAAVTERFADEGWNAPDCFVATPSEAARRDR